MLRFFQSAYLSRYIMVIAMALVFWLPTFLLLPVQYDYQAILIVLPEANGQLTYLFHAVSLLLLLFTGLMTNQIGSDAGFTARISTLALFIYILFGTALTSFTGYSIFFLTGLLFAFFLRLLYYIPETEKTIILSFNVAMIPGLAALFFPPALYLILLLWIALVIHRSAHWKSLVASLMGLISPLFFVFLWSFWYDRTEVVLSALKTLFTIDPTYLITLHIMDYVILFLVVLLTLAATLRASATLIEKNINLRRNMILTLYFLLIITLIAILFGAVEKSLMMISLPAALLVAQTVQDIKRVKPYNFAFSILLILVLVDHYLKLLI
jgi:hypothetical protein